MILATTNTTVDQINNIATNIINGNKNIKHIIINQLGIEQIKLSYDNILDDSHQHLYPTEFINISGLPPHKLILKKNQPIISLRNINSHEGNSIKWNKN